MVKWLSDNSIFHPRSCYKISSYNGYWTVKCKEAISAKKVLILLTYIILSNSLLMVNAQSLNQTKNSGKVSSANYEEFIFEHQVTRQDAIDALQKLNQSFFDGPTGSTCKSISCTQNVMKYCHGQQFINDHCWCEQGHANEGLPFIPHICYVGEKQYQASVGSCFFYEEVKECCCAPALAKQWKHISAGPKSAAHSHILVIALVVISHFGAYNFLRQL